MSPDQPTPETEESKTPSSDERDDRGIVYHGDDWDKPESENERGLVSDEETTQEFEDDEDDDDEDVDEDVPDDDVK